MLGKSLEKLSSGFRINRAADDAAGLVKSEMLRAEINGTAQAIKNSQDGVSFMQTGEGALNEVHSILQRMRTLAVDAANSATTDGSAQQAEVTELDSIGAKTTFAGTSIFQDYSTTNLTFQTGGSAGATNQLSVSSDLVLASNDVFSVDISGIDLTSDATNCVGVRHSGDARCHPEPARAHHQQPVSGPREPCRLREPHPRHGHGARDGELHASPGDDSGWNCDARPGEPAALHRSCPS